MLIKSPQVVSAKEENTKLKHIKAAAELVKSSHFGETNRSFNYTALQSKVGLFCYVEIYKKQNPNTAN